MLFLSKTSRMALAALLVAFWPAQVKSGITQQESSQRTLRLEDLERMALENNPTIAQAEAAVRAAEGRRVQAGLYPNPILGYLGEELSFRALPKLASICFLSSRDSSRPESWARIAGFSLKKRLRWKRISRPSAGES